MASGQWLVTSRSAGSLSSYCHLDRSDAFRLRKASRSGEARCLAAPSSPRSLCEGGALIKMKVQAYVFIDTENPGPKRAVKLVRKIPGVVRADALLGVPDVIALVEGDDIAKMDAVIDQIAEIDGVLDTESEVVRWV